MEGVLNECVLPHHREVGRTTVRVLAHKSRNMLLLQQDRPVQILAALVLIDAEAESLGHCKVARCMRLSDSIKVRIPEPPSKKPRRWVPLMCSDAMMLCRQMRATGKDLMEAYLLSG